MLTLMVEHRNYLPMGWKLCGIAINENFEKDTDSLFDILKIKNHTFIEESCFEDETIQIIEGNQVAVGFFDGGTLLFTQIELMTDDNSLTLASLNHSIVAFYINDVTSTYCFDYYRIGKYVRRKWISFGDADIDDTENFGSQLEEEYLESDHLEIIFNVISSTLGKTFYSIEESEPFLKFSINNSTTQVLQPVKKSFWQKLFN